MGGITTSPLIFCLVLVSLYPTWLPRNTGATREARHLLRDGQPQLGHSLVLGPSLECERGLKSKKKKNQTNKKPYAYEIVSLIFREVKELSQIQLV